jgi:hypothetical protein
MKTENWLAIVAIIAASITTLAAPIVAEFVKSRISQPKPTPDVNQPENAIQRIEGLIRASWIYLFAIVLNICVLLWELHRASVPIRWDEVLSIAVTTGSIYFSLSLIFTTSLTRRSEN